MQGVAALAAAIFFLLIYVLIVGFVISVLWNFILVELLSLSVPTISILGGIAIAFAIWVVRALIG